PSVSAAERGALRSGGQETGPPGAEGGVTAGRAAGDLRRQAAGGTEGVARAGAGGRQAAAGLLRRAGGRRLGGGVGDLPPGAALTTRGWCKRTGSEARGDCSQPAGSLRSGTTDAHSLQTPGRDTPRGSPRG